VDDLVETLSPGMALRRREARMKLEALDSLSGGGYGKHGASRKKRSMFRWQSGGGDPDGDITDNLETLRERSRDLYMGGGLAAGAIKTVRANVVGPGLRLNAQIDSEYLGFSDEEARRWERQTEREFSLWAESPLCDAARICDFYGLQRLAFLSFLMNGDVFVPLIMQESSRLPYALRVRLLEGDVVCNPENIPPDRDIRGGVEVDENGAPLAYWICKAHPKSTTSTSSAIRRRYQWERWPAYGERSGRRNILHLMDPERINQRRGTPFLAPVIEDLKQIARYTEAELMAAVVNGFLTVFITSEKPEAMEGMGGFLDEGAPVDDPQAMELGTGTVLSLEPGEKVQTVDSKRPTVAFDYFVTAMSRQIGAALGLPYEVLIKHFTASYSASRGALLEAWKFFKMWRFWFSGSFCSPIYEAWLEEAVASGRIWAPGFFDDPMTRKAYCGAVWHGPSQGQLNPMQEVNAATERVNQGFSTRSHETAELTGGDWERNHRQRVAEEKARREGGLVGAEGEKGK